jgi:Zn-finger nucleic acid-binding protein
MHFSECKRCEGLWLDVESFRTICEERESHSFILGEAGLVVPPEGFPIEQVRYIPCPSCSQLMQRVNFAKCSGVVVDVCREHGTWVDKMELQRIVQFIRNGGMSKARQKQLEDLEEKRRRLAETNTRTRHLDSQRSTVAYELVGDPCFWSAIGEAAGGVWNLFTD